MKTAKLICLLLGILFVIPSFAQLRIGEKVKNQTNSRVDQRVDEGIDRGLNKIEEGVGNLFKKKKQAGEEPEEAATGGEAEQEERPVPAAGNSAQPQDKLQSFSKYDFVPGDKILFFEDFSQDAIGDFPALWTTNGSGEVKTLNMAAGNWFHLNGADAVYCFPKNIDFPDNFIVEFDIIPDEVYQYGITLTLYEDASPAEVDNDLYPGEKGLHITLDADRWATKGYNNVDQSDWLEGESETAMVEKEKINHVIIWIQKRRVRIYHKGSKALDMPTNISANTKFNRFRFSGWDANSFPYLTNLKITTAAPDTRSKLLTEGKLISYGIYFDSGKDVVKPESYGALNDIAKVLKENPGVKVKIVGHTDSDGADAANLDLSKRRGAAVKNELVKTFGIDAAGLEADGMGENQPVAPNDTPANKALNRRVEFIKL